MAVTEVRSVPSMRETREEAERRKVRGRTLRLLGTLVIFLILTAYALASLLPLYWMFTTSIKIGDAILSVPPQFIPYPISFDAYKHFFDVPNSARWFVNSIVVVSAITLGRIVLASMAGYAFAKFRFPGSNILFWVIIGTLMIPDQVVLIPLYSLIVNWNWLNTYQALILPPIGNAFYVFLMKQYMQSLPSSLIDAARIDACSEFGIFRKIILPLALPGLAVTAVFSFVNSWNAFIWPLLVAARPDMFTIQVGLAWVRYGPLDWGMLMAGASAAAVPVILLFLIFQRYVVRGLTVGAVKT